MATLILNAGTPNPILLVVSQAGENAPTEIGTVTQSANGADRSSVRGTKRNFGALTTYVNTATKESILSLLRSGAQIPCSGDLLANIQTLCTMRYTGAKMMPGLVDFWEVGLTGNEVQPSVVLVKYAPGDTITGESFTRSTVGFSINASSVMISNAINAKRDSHYVGGVRSTLLEDTRINGILQSQTFNTTWTQSDVTLSVNATTGPDGTTTAEKMIETATTQPHQVYQSITTTASTAQPPKVYLKASERTWAYVQTNLRDGTIARSWVNLTTGAIGTKHAAHTIRVRTLTNNWQEIECVVNSGAGASATFFAVGLATGDAVDTYLGVAANGAFIWGGQHEQDKPFASSYIITTTAPVVRGADFYSLPCTAPPQELSVYAKFVELGTILSPFGRVFTISNAADAAPEFLILPSGGFYQAYHNNGVSVVTSTLAVAPAIGDTVELAARLAQDGSCQISQSINGGAVVSAAQSGRNALAAAWSGNLVWLNSAGSVAAGFTALQSFKIVAGARSLAEVREA